MNTKINACPQLNRLQDYEFVKTPVMAGKMSIGDCIALKPIVENLDLDWSGQLKKLKRDDPQNQLWTFQKVYAEDGKAYEMVCMKPKEFQDWLYGLNVSENLNVPLWEEYKKGLLVYLLSMLQISFDEITRLRSIELEFKSFQTEVLEYIKTHNEGKDLTQQAKVKFKDSNKMEKKIIDRISNINPDQLKLLY